MPEEGEQAKMARRARACTWRGGAARAHGAAGRRASSGRRASQRAAARENKRAAVRAERVMMRCVARKDVPARGAPAEAWAHALMRCGPHAQVAATACRADPERILPTCCGASRQMPAITRVFAVVLCCVRPGRAALAMPRMPLGAGWICDAPDCAMRSPGEITCGGPHSGWQSGRVRGDARCDTAAESAQS